MNWRDGESNPKILQHSAAFFQRFDYGAALKIECKMSDLTIAFDRYASIGIVMHYILVISLRFRCRDETAIEWMQLHNHITL